jgi:uncharacterized protein
LVRVIARELSGEGKSPPRLNPMIPSKFNIIVENYPCEGQNILYNARTQALVKIDHSFRDALRALPGSLEDPCLKNNLQGLLENGLICADERQEQGKLDDFFTQLKAGSDSFPFELTVLTTYGCNFRCVYCFEESVKENTDMSVVIAAKTVDWLISKISRAGIKKVFIIFYGGEPLLNTAPIYSISRSFGAWAKEHGVGFAFGLITNGSLVTRKLVDELLPLGLQELRISIDGDRAAHDAYRPALDNSPTFDLIIANIKSVVDIVPVAIAGNFDRKNYDSIPRFLDFLEQEGLLRKLKYVNFLPIAPRLGPKNNPGAVELGECVSFFGKEGMFREILEIKQELFRRGLKSPSGLAVNACSLIMRDSGAAIDPFGRIFKCNALLGYPEFSVGNVKDEAPNEREAEFAGADAWKKCEPDCPYVPLCQGGCRFFSFLEHQNFSSLVCKRDYFDSIIPELIKIEYRNVSGTS